MTIFAMAVLLIAGVAGAIIVSDDSSADPNSTATVYIENSKVGTGATTVALVTFTENDAVAFQSVSWTAKLVNSSGSSQSSALDVTEGSSTDAVSTWQIKITAPSTTGTYTLEVKFTEKVEQDGATKTLDSVTKKATLQVMEPITLSVKVSNSGNLDVSGASVYFYVDGKKIEDSKTTLTVAAGSSTTISYKYYDANLSSGKHTYYVESADGAYIEGLDSSGSNTFYYNQSSQDYMTYIMIVIMIIVLICLIVVYRKPVKNYGKPKARR